LTGVAFSLYVAGHMKSPQHRSHPLDLFVDAFRAHATEIFHSL
jgi:hypothetical protein